MVDGTNGPLPADIAGLNVPQDAVAEATWAWAGGHLPAYLLAHSVRSYCWGAALANREGWAFDRQVLWTAALLHDFGLTRIARNTMCFEIEGAEIARPLLERFGMTPDAADRAAIAIILHMQPNVTLSDGVEAVLLDRATGLDVRGIDFDRVDADTRNAVIAAFPRADFDRRFEAAIRREVARRGDCQSARLLGSRRGPSSALRDGMAASPWASRGIRG
jgi:cyanamide hydratase family protein with HD domain